MGKAKHMDFCLYTVGSYTLWVAKQSNSLCLLCKLWLVKYRLCVY